MDIMNQGINIKIFSSSEKLFQFAAEDFKNRILITLKTNKSVSVALPGGNTPKLFFDALIKHFHQNNNISWDKIKFFFGDERYVPSTSTKNNYHMTNQYLFSKVPINPKYIFPIPTNLTDSEKAAIYYEQTITHELILKNNLPYFDLIYLGLGEDGHTASLMPDSNIVKNYIKDPSETRFVESDYIPHLQMYRITLTPPIINNAGCIIFLVTGLNKANAVKSVLERTFKPNHYPAQLIHSTQGETIWYLDNLSASQLNQSLQSL